MIFCGIEETSLDDFPGKVSCVIFTSGCNFLCPYCHNPQTALNDQNQNTLSTDDVFRFLEQRKKFYDGIVISGGEPTLNQELPAICKKIKQMGYCVKLDTNGSRPDMLAKLLKENVLDYVAMDIKDYPSEHLYKKFTKEPDIVNKIAKSIELIMAKAPNYEFRTTCVNPFITRKKIKQICELIYGAEHYILQPFNKKAFSILNENFFANITPSISRKEMLKFVEIAKPIVKHCKANVIS